MGKVGQSKKELVVQSEDENSLVMPDWMRNEEVTGLEDAQQYIVPPRLKVVQKQSGDTFTSQFNPGDVIVVPQMVLVAPVKLNDKKRPGDEGEAFFFTPIFFFPEWLQVSPIELKGQVDFIRQRTVDPNDPLVAKCRNKKLWLEPCPEDPALFVRNVEVLNFIVLLQNHELAGTPMVMSFAKAEHRAGSTFLGNLKMRKAAIFGNVFQANTRFRADNLKGQWYGIDVSNPALGYDVKPFINNKDEYERYKALHLEFKDAHSKSIIQVDYDDEPQDEPGDSGEF